MVTPYKALSLALVAQSQHDSDSDSDTFTPACSDTYSDSDSMQDDMLNFSFTIDTLSQ